MSKPTDRRGLGSLATGAVTGLALAVQTGLAAVVGVIIAREFGRTAETDGFFAAYGVFIVLALAATAIRVTVLPRFARARAGGRLAGEVVAVGRAVTLVAVPAVVLCVLAREQLAAVLTGSGPEAAQAAAAAALPWMGLAAAGQLVAGLLASAFAALDDYVVPASGYIAGSLLGLVLILALVDEHGIVTIAWGVTLNAAVAMLVPAVVLIIRSRAESVPRTALGARAGSAGRVLLDLGVGTSVPLALQVVYLVCLPVAARSGVGSVTTLGYGYLAGSAVVMVTASSIGLVTSVPLTRVRLDPAAIARHVDASSWVALIAIGATAGIFATAGARLFELVLGYGPDVGDELAWVVVALVPWMVVSVGVTLVYPLVFVAEVGRALALVAGVSIVSIVPLGLAGEATAGLTGVALALAGATGIALWGMLHLLRATGPTLRGLLPGICFVGAFTVVAYGTAGALLDAAAAAVAGTVVYALLLAVVRPRGLTDSWRYLRRLG